MASNRLYSSVDKLEERGFAGAGRPGKKNKIPFGDIQADAGECRRVFLILYGYVMQFYHS
jgi:hypothetical protein